MNLCIFTVFLKNKNIIFKIRRSKVTDYAALTVMNRLNKNVAALFKFHFFCKKGPGLEAIKLS